MLEFVVRLAVGAVAMVRGGGKLLGSGGLSATAARFETLGFRAPRGATVVAAGLEIVGGGLFLAGLFTPLAGALVGVVALTGLAVRRRDGWWFTDAASLVDAALLAGSVWLMYVGPGLLAYEESLDLAVQGGAVGTGGVFLLLLGTGGGLMAVDSNKASRAQDETVEEEEPEPIPSTPVEPVMPEEATDPGAATEGDSARDPVRAHDHEHARA